MLRLKCAAQTYAWGRPAAESEVIDKEKEKKKDNSIVIEQRLFFLSSKRHEGRHCVSGPNWPLVYGALRLPSSREQRESSLEGSCFLRIGEKSARWRIPCGLALNNVEKEIRETAPVDKKTQPRFFLFQKNNP